MNQPTSPAIVLSPITPLRSMLFIPADSDRKLAKGEATGTDALILDL
jgi:citrate lyase subunit beta/citryl-CoA lyase